MKLPSKQASVASETFRAYLGAASEPVAKNNVIKQHPHSQNTGVSPKTAKAEAAALGQESPERQQSFTCADIEQTQARRWRLLGRRYTSIRTSTDIWEE